MSRPDTTDFGFERVPAADKGARVRRVFESVADRYDLMNDLMSFGLHRLWKRFAVHVAGVRAGARVLDLAGGTGDCAALYRERVGAAGSVTVCDINDAMLRRGRDRLLDAGHVAGLQFVQADAEQLPFAEGRFDCVNIAFGLRNVTRREAALAAMHRVLCWGGTVIILEFSKATLPLFARIYERYSFEVIPALGEFVAGDRDSYRYLVESIRMFPDRETLREMMEQAGFARVECFSLSGGIVAVHRGRRI
jgi:demethylmenaquinone methyltransferase/2-methoxy-6-polyprenyl-1,4-benzoquinol methylase